MTLERNIILIASDSESCRAIKRHMQQQQIEFTEVPSDTPGAERYCCPSLLVYGVLYQGPTAIKAALRNDHNIR